MRLARCLFRFVLVHIDAFEGMLRTLRITQGINSIRNK